MRAKPRLQEKGRERWDQDAASLAITENVRDEQRRTF
jgi:hypothetical protein